MNDIEPQPPTLRELALEEAALKALIDTVTVRYKAVRRDVQDQLLKARAESGTRQVSAILPGEEDGLATISIPAAEKVAEVDDEDAFLQWCLTNAHTEIERVWVKTVRPAYRTKILAEMTAAGVPEICDPETGVITTIPGVSVRVRRDSSHVLRFRTGGRDKIRDAWRNGTLGIPGIDTPEIESAATEDNPDADA